MSRISCIVPIALLVISCISTTQTIDVQTKGLDNGVKAEDIDSKELRNAKSLVESGDRSKADKIITDIINTGKNENVIAEALYYRVVWQFTKDERGTFEKLEANYPNSKYVGRLKKILTEREAQKRRLEQLKAKWGQGAVRKDGDFIAFDNGVILDANSGLEWITGPDKNTNWDVTKLWVKNLTVDGGGWRMPTRMELKALYRYGVGTRNMSSLLKTTGWYVWSGKTSGSLSAWGFDFIDGHKTWYGRDGSYNFRGFAVRSRKKRWKSIPRFL